MAHHVKMLHHCTDVLHLLVWPSSLRASKSTLYARLMSKMNCRHFFACNLMVIRCKSMHYFKSCTGLLLSLLGVEIGSFLTKWWLYLELLRSSDFEVEKKKPIISYGSVTIYSCTVFWKLIRSAKGGQRWCYYKRCAPHQTDAKPGCLGGTANHEAISWKHDAINAEQQGKRPFNKL